MKKKIILGVVILVVIAGIVFGFAFIRGNKNNRIGYKKEAIDRGNIEALVVTTGTLNPVIIVDVGSQVSGKILKLYVDFNSLVQEGQVIAEIDQSIFLTRVKQNEANYLSSMATLEKAKVSLENNRKKHERAKNLFNKTLISYEEFETVETQYFSSKADLQFQEARLEQAMSTLDSSKVDLSYTIIKSPIDGIVINRNINVGQTVAASFQAPVLFQIANDLSKMQVECSVDEADIGKVKEEQKVKFTVDAFPDENFAGIVSQVRYSPEVISNVVTYTTIVEVDNPELKLRPGMTATVSIVTGEAKMALRVPVSAMRFTPSLSPEEMKKIFEDMQQEMRGDKPTQAEGTTTERRSGRQSQQRPDSGGQHSTMLGSGQGQYGSNMKQFSRVWIEDENGKLKLVFIKTGVTDNTYTEVTWGDLKEGQEVITGEASGEEGGRSSSSSLRRGMMFMRR
ncbi:MAG: efflux RND transporter periplasmic adaptor subunit [Candidatus Aminicenantes bacterium]|nr:MAG: efflux RND transporter periplasmic adaptor subunit [Candidatus Aminicenantes bacterium]